MFSVTWQVLREATLLFWPRECRGIRAIVSPVSPIGIGKFVCEIQCAPLTPCTHYATMLKFSNFERRYDFNWIDGKRFHATLQETDWVGSIT